MHILCNKESLSFRKVFKFKVSSDTRAVSGYGTMYVFYKNHIP
jgi:hypothetical protein